MQSIIGWENMQLLHSKSMVWKYDYHVPEPGPIRQANQYHFCDLQPQAHVLCLHMEYLQNISLT